MKRVCVIAVVVVILAGVCFAQSPRQVEVVAEVSLTNQTGTVYGTLYTPPQTGVFRVSFMLQCTKGDPVNGQGLFPSIGWTDDNHDELFSPGGPVLDQRPGAPSSFIVIIKAIAGTPISWSVNPVNKNDTSEYEVYIALERIGPKVQ